MARKRTIGDIALLAGVSKATVSRVLNQKPDVDPATRERILRIVEEEGFVPSLTAAGLARRHSHLIGVLVPSFTWPMVPDIVCVLAWLDLPAAERPRFLTLYFDEVDHAGHVHGPDSIEVDTALRDTDAALARLVDGLKQRGLFDRINLIVLSDHGMAAVPEANSVMLDELVPLDRVQTVSMGILAGFNPASDSAQARADFAQVEQTLEQPQPHMQCWDKTRVPARLAYGRNPRVPQLLCLANVHWRITTSDYAAKRKGRLSLGEHGYDNAEPLMQALFVAHGPAFRAGAKVPAFPNVDVYPLMTRLLGLPAAANDGDYDAVKGMLKPAAR